MGTHTAEYMRAYYAKNAEKIRARMRRDNMPPEKWEQRLAQMRKVQQTPERKKYMRQYYLKNKEKLRAYGTSYARTYRANMSPEAYEKVRERERELDRRHGRSGAAKLRARHGFTVELLAKCFEFQGHACAICRAPFTSKGKHRPCADHSHETNTPRGILCFECNIVEGKIRNTGLSVREFAERLHNYLANPPALT